MSFVLDILANLVWDAIKAVIALLGTITPIALLCIALCAIVFSYYLGRNSLIKHLRGRAVSMAANVQLLKRRSKFKITDGPICSTRFAKWPLSESSTERVAYRNELTEAIVKEGREVRRLWNVSSREDAQRLLTMIDAYKDRQNLSKRVFFDLPDHLLPEIQIIHDRLGSLAFSHSLNPDGMVTVTIFYGKDSVRNLRDYFDNLWNSAEHLLEAGEIDAGTLQKVRKRAAKS